MREEGLRHAARFSDDAIADGLWRAYADALARR